MGANSSQPTTSCSSDDTEVNPVAVSENEIEEVRNMAERSKEIRLMVTGKTGNGKSTLLNGMLGEKVFKEGDNYDPQTVKVDSRTIEKNGITITVFDTPGLQDGSGNEGAYLEDMRNKCTNIHLLIYCIDMSKNRSDLHIHNSAIKKITDHLGKEVWENAVIVLTFANVFERRSQDRGLDDNKIKADFKAKLKEWESTFHSALEAAGVPKDVCVAIRAHPAGLANKPSLISQKYWLSNFWIESVFSMKEEAQAAMVKASFDRFRDKEDLTQEDFEQDISKQPLVFSKMDKAALGSVVAVTGGVAGATTGALIGALVIGIPTFGLATGLGLAIGGMIGGAAGAGAGVGTGLLLAIYRRSKKKKKIASLKKKAIEQFAEELATTK